MSTDLLKVYSITSTPGKRDFYPHHHNELEIAYFYSGSGTYSVTGHDYPIESGDIFMFSNNEIHKITFVAPNVEMRALNIHFLPRILLGGTGDPELSRLFFDRRIGFTNRINREVAGDSYDAIQTALFDVEREASRGIIGSEMLARQSLLRALVFIMRSCKIVRGEGESRTQNSVGGIVAALDYIDENYKSELTLAGICEVAHMSRSNFERLFGRLAGVSVGEYVKRRRIDCAISLLRTTNMTVLDVALASGFHNTANFNKQFRCVTGKAPGDYRID